MDFGLLCENDKGEYVVSETHKGLKRVTLICLLCPMLVIIHLKVPYLEREEEITDQSNFVPAPA